VVIPAAVLEQLLEVAGAVLILAAFALNLFRGLDRHALLYLLLNLIGAAILTAIAWRHQQWGFFLVEGVWSLVSLWGVLGLLRRAGSPA
jgi:hypothetical protein